MSIVHLGDGYDEDLTDGDSAEDWPEDWTEDWTDGWTDGWADDSADDSEASWRGGADPDLVAGLRLVLSDAYADASDADVEDALTDVMGAMGPAEAFNFGRALSQVARGAGRALSDPQVAAIARTALPIAGGALGTVIGGPVGTALGGQLGTIAANALPPPPAARAAGRPAATRPVTAGRPAVPMAGGPAVGAPAATPTPAPTPTPSLPGGSTAAAQGLSLAGSPLMQQALAAAAFGQQGQQQVAGIPVAQLLGLLGQLVGQAAADADELVYRTGGADHETGEAEDVGVEDVEAFWSGAGGQDLYTAVMDAEALDLAEAMEELAETAP